MCACVIFESVSLHDASCLLCLCVATALCVAATPVLVWHELSLYVARKLWAHVCVCVFARWNGMHVYRVAERGWVAACRDDGIGKRSLSLWPTAKPAGDATAISSLTPVLCLSDSLALFSRSFLFFLIFERAPFIFSYLSRNLFLRLCLFSPHFLSALFSLYSSLPLYFFFFHVFLLLTVPSFHTTNCLLLPSQAECISNRTRYWNERLERKLTNVRIYTPWGCRLCVEYRT